MRLPWLPHDLRYQVVRLRLADMLTVDIAKAINVELARRNEKRRLTDESVRGVLTDLWKEGHLLLVPPAEKELARTLASSCHVSDEQVCVVSAPLFSEAETNEAAASAAADVAIVLIERIAADRKEVHIGIGAGQTSYYACVRLAQRLRGSDVLLRRKTQLVFHAISPGCDAARPLDDPSAKFALLDRIGLPTSFIGLFAEAVVPSDRIDQVRQLPGTRRAYERKWEIDLVLTSIASRSSEHGLYNRYAQCYPDAMRQLMRLDWVGDVHFRPFAADGPIRQDVGIEAVTLFTIDELRQLAGEPNKHVVLISGPGKGEALIPLIRNPELRCWDYLATDADTARLIDAQRNSRPDPRSSDPPPEDEQTANEPPPPPPPADEQMKLPPPPPKSKTLRQRTKKSQRRQR